MVSPMSKRDRSDGGVIGIDPTEGSDSDSSSFGRK
jgi:hypothetical protein